MPATDSINTGVPPSGTGCAACEASGGWWFHLRRCAECGTIGCCDSSPSAHASAHAAETGHQVIQSFEPGEDWFYDFGSGEMFEGPTLADPQSHPVGAAVPGPADRVPADWQDRLN